MTAKQLQLLRYFWAGKRWNPRMRLSSSLFPCHISKLFHKSHIEVKKTSKSDPPNYAFTSKKFRGRKNKEKNFRRMKLYICGVGKSMGLEARRLGFLVLTLPLKVASEWPWTKRWHFLGLVSKRKGPGHGYLYIPAPTHCCFFSF